MNKMLDGYKKMCYYLHLNRWGRKTARDGATDKSTFVALLGRVQEADEESSFGLQPIDKFNVQFGLLSEEPGLWGHSHSE
jgi:hypothetical protein